MSPSAAVREALVASRVPVAVVATSILGWAAVAYAACPIGCYAARDWFIKDLNVYYHYESPIAHPYDVYHTYADWQKTASGGKTVQASTMSSGWLCAPFSGYVSQASFDTRNIQAVGSYNLPDTCVKN